GRAGPRPAAEAQGQGRRHGEAAGQGRPQGRVAEANPASRGQPPLAVRLLKGPPVTRWRLLVGGVLLALVALPLGPPFIELLADPAAWAAWSDPGRLLVPAGDTLLLVVGTLALALPPGVVGAILLYRTDLPFRRGL